MPERWSKGSVPLISMEESQDYKKTTKLLKISNICFLQIVED